MCWSRGLPFLYRGITMPLVMRQCSKCHEEFPLKESFYFSKRDGLYYRHCKLCHASLSNGTERKTSKKPSKHKGIKARILRNSRCNARKNGVEHNIKVADISLPVICKYLGIRIDYRSVSERGNLRSWRAPSIDRIDPTKGYIPGNVQIISDLANRMKQNATIPQMLAFAQGVLRVHGDR